VATFSATVSKWREAGCVAACADTINEAGAWISKQTVHTSTNTLAAIKAVLDDRAVTTVVLLSDGPVIKILFFLLENSATSQFFPGGKNSDLPSSPRGAASQNQVTKTDHF
jgi:hypothetical protein